MVARVLNWLSSSFTGVPAKVSIIELIAVRTVAMFVLPIDPEVSTTIPKFPPQRLRAAVSVWLKETEFVARVVLRSVPPALRLIWFLPPPEPARSPPPLMVTTTRWPFLFLNVGSSFEIGVVPSMSAGFRAWLTVMIHVGGVTPSTYDTPIGGGSRSWSTVLTVHVGAALLTLMHWTLIIWYSVPTRTYLYETLVSVGTATPPAPGTEPVQVSIRAFVPPVLTPAGQFGAHGDAPGEVSTPSADAKSVGIHTLTFCTDRALLTRPVVLSLCLYSTL